MNRADIGRIYKEKRMSNGTIYFTEMMSSVFLVLAEDTNHQIIFSQIFPFTSTTKVNQRKLAKDIFNKIRQKLYNKEDLTELD